MKSIFTRASLVAGLVALLSMAAFAQTSAPPQGGTEAEGRRDRIGEERRMRGRRGERGVGREGRRGGMARRALRGLNLSDAQRGQLREIEARYGQGFKGQHQELRKLMELRADGATLTPEQEQRARQLRTEARGHAERLHAEILAVLTPEQRDQLKRMREEGEARRRQRREALDAPPDNE
ncbi:MAG TPA: Spy/CpxP family protein refolding chaperone [Pyrinomonadaceae bacterium]|nr:Spy/CpxP family protein refolding chaperone [Pyrinomonadaceae bacterium]